MATKKTGKLLTEVELEFMNILWKVEKGTVHDVIDNLPKDRKLAYNSVSTILRILEQKGILKSEKAGRGHLYIPKLLKNEYEHTSVNHLLEKVFDGNRISVIRQLLDDKNISDAELEELKKLLGTKAD